MLCSTSQPVLPHCQLQDAGSYMCTSLHDSMNTLEDLQGFHALHMPSCWHLPQGRSQLIAAASVARGYCINRIQAVHVKWTRWQLWCRAGSHGAPSFQNFDTNADAICAVINLLEPINAEVVAAVDGLLGEVIAKILTALISYGKVVVQRN